METQANQSDTKTARRERPRLLLLISNGWAVRNYVRSGFIELLEPEVDITVMMPPGDAAFEAEMHARGLGVVLFRSLPMPRKLSTWMTLLTHATNRRLNFHDPHLWQWMDALEPAWKRPLLRLLRQVSRLISVSPRYEAARRLEERWMREAGWHDAYQDLLAALKPDVVFSTNPYSSQELPVSLQALERGLPTIEAIVSWDNLTYKGHLIADATRYLVWSEMMKQDLLLHRPDLKPDDVFITGTPQFDFHLREDLYWSRDAFFERIGGDPARKLITYAASPEQAFPDETEVVTQLWRAIEEGRIVDRPQLLVRPHPHDEAQGRFDALSEQCPGLLVCRPWPYSEKRFWWYTPGIEAMALLANTLRYQPGTSLPG